QSPSDGHHVQPKPSTSALRSTISYGPNQNFPSVLNVSDAQHEDAGLYKCDVTAISGSRIIQWNLTVSEKPEVFHQDDHKDERVYRGDSISFDCNTSKANTTQITWIKDGFSFYAVRKNQTFSNFPSHRLRIDQNFPSVLNVSDAQHEDEGLYKCVVTTISGSRIIQWNLRVSEKPEGLRVIGGDKSVVEKGTVVLPCIITDNKESMSQILWRRVTRGKPLIDDFFTILDTNEAKYLNGHDLRFQFIGDINKDNGSLQLSNAKLEDEGTYICVVTVFPSGNYQADITLNLLGLKETTNTTTHGNGTTTTVSSLFGVPNMQIYQQEVKCVITSAAPSGSKTLIYSIQIHCEYTNTSSHTF
ncbi:Hemicentin-1, partial [Nibea albiflora]